MNCQPSMQLPYPPIPVMVAWIWLTFTRISISSLLCCSCTISRKCLFRSSSSLRSFPAYDGLFRRKFHQWTFSAHFFTSASPSLRRQTNRLTSSFGRSRTEFSSSIWFTRGAMSVNLFSIRSRISVYCTALSLASTMAFKNWSNTVSRTFCPTMVGTHAMCPRSRVTFALESRYRVGMIHLRGWWLVEEYAQFKLCLRAWKK